MNNDLVFEAESPDQNVKPKPIINIGPLISITTEDERRKGIKR